MGIRVETIATSSTHVLALLLSSGLLACSSSSTTPTADPRQQVASLARDDIACTSDADCCVVFDTCMNDGYVVSARDEVEAASLLASADQSRCTACIPPATQVSCGPTGFCMGAKIECSGTLFQGGMKNHCGALAIPAECALQPAFLRTPAPAAKTILHCG